jgi:hypothetical protein
MGTGMASLPWALGPLLRARAMPAGFRCHAQQLRDAPYNHPAVHKNSSAIMTAAPSSRAPQMTV